MSNLLYYLGTILLIWWMNSFWIVYLDYIQNRINIFWFILGEIINVLTFIFILTTVQNYGKPLAETFILLGFFLIMWFSHYMWVDYQAVGTKLWLRLMYGTIDLATCIYICLILYKNIFITTNIGRLLEKEMILASLENLLSFGRLLVA